MTYQVTTEEGVLTFNSLPKNTYFGGLEGQAFYFDGPCLVPIQKGSKDVYTTNPAYFGCSLKFIKNFNYKTLKS